MSEASALDAKVVVHHCESTRYLLLQFSLLYCNRYLIFFSYSPDGFFFGT